MRYYYMLKIGSVIITILVVLLLTDGTDYNITSSIGHDR